MGTLLVTFGKSAGELENLSDAVTYSLAIGADEHSLVIPQNCSVITLLPDAACWVAGGREANAEHANPTQQRRPLAANALVKFACKPGHVLSVIQRS